MAYVIYNKETTKFLTVRKGYRTIESYKTEAAAKAALTRLTKAGKLGDKVTQEPTAENNWERLTVPHVKEDFAIAEKAHFHAEIELKEIRKGIVHSAGQEFEVGVNTPWTSGPWSETYFCS